jgi:hypothetical protein
MPAKSKGVYQEKNGRWYLKVDLGNDTLTGKRSQITRRGFRTAAEAGRERRELLNKVDTGQLSLDPPPRPGRAGLKAPQCRGEGAGQRKCGEF